MQPRRSDHQGKRGSESRDSESRGSNGRGAQDELIIDCDRCSVRGDACHDCVVSLLLGPPPEIAQQRIDESHAGGGRPRLRLVPVEPVESDDGGRRAG